MNFNLTHIDFSMYWIELLYKSYLVHTNSYKYLSRTLETELEKMLTKLKNKIRKEINYKTNAYLPPKNFMHV